MIKDFIYLKNFLPLNLILGDLKLNSRKNSISGALVYIMNKFINLTIAILKPLIKESKYYLKYCYRLSIHEATGLIVNLF